MTRTKFTSLGMAGMLALSLGLAACGGGSTSTTSTASTSSTDATSVASTSSVAAPSSATSATSTVDTTSTASTTDTTPAFNHEGYWSGSDSDGATIYYMEDTGNGIWELVLVPSDSSNTEGALLVNGVATKIDDGITITDINTGEVVDVSFLNESDTEIEVRVGDVEAILTPCSLDDFLAGEDAVFAIQASA